MPGRRQAFRVVRRRTVLASGRSSVETADGVASLATDRAGPSEILALNRSHCEIENPVHDVSDAAYDEDRSRVRTGRMPRNLACLSNAAISIVRMRGEFRHQPQAHRHYATKQADTPARGPATGALIRFRTEPSRPPGRRSTPPATQNSSETTPERAVRQLHARSVWVSGTATNKPDPPSNAQAATTESL